MAVGMRRDSMHRWKWIVGLSLGLSATAGAVPGEKAARMLPVTRGNVEHHFGGPQTFKKMQALALTRQWKPSKQWLETHGRKYGTLLVVSDTHPGAGVDPTTGKTSPAEDFLTRQEIDFHDMLSSEWKLAKRDGQKRTLVLNGDTLEFMQTTTPPEGAHFEGKADKYGPLNTPRNIRTKLDAIREGHPGLFAAYVDHMLEGHRIVMLPGNHDRQLQHPAVRARLRAILVEDMTAKLEKDGKFEPGSEGAGRRVAAIKKAREIVSARFEFKPHFFLHGDTFMQHGHQNDPFNSFSTLLGSYYSKAMARNEVMEGAMGDYIVKALFNEMEARIPWGDNGKVTAAFKAIYKAKGPLFAARWLVTKLPVKYQYILTREGHFGPEAQQALAAREHADLGRIVKDDGLVEKLNELRPGQPPLDEKQIVDLLVEYQTLQAKPVLSYFKAGQGLLGRMLTAAGNAKTLMKELPDEKRLEREETAVQFLFSKLNIKTHATGHDHVFREERYIVGDEGHEKLGRTLDSSTWTDAMAGDSRDSMLIGTERRGVIKIKYSESGSNARLLNWDPARKRLMPVQVLPGVEESLTEVRASNKK
jgi:hypothetical protein